MKRRTHVRRLARHTAATVTACLLALGVTVASGTAPAQAFESERTAMQGFQTTMGQTNGPVWTMEIAGGRIYAGGSFTSTRPSGAALGTGETGQGFLAAFDGATGAPISSFNPVLTNNYNGNPGVVRATAVSPDGRTLFVGGDFNRVNGQKANYLAKFDAATGQFLGEVGNNGVDGAVTALAISPDGQTLYAGGRFNRANYSARYKLAAFDLTGNGTALRSWSPRVSTPTRNEAIRVTALAVSSDSQRVFIAGPWQQVNGSAAQGFAATDAATGNLVPGFRSNYLYAPHSWGTTIEVADNEVFLGSRDDFTSGSQRNEGVYSINATSGAVNWYSRCYGDTFGLQVLGNEVYVASHAHDCSPMGGHPELNPRTYLAIHALSRSNGRVKPYFVQTAGNTTDANTRLLSRALATDGNQLVMGGGFLRVNGQNQQNVTRFLAGSSAPDRAAYPTATTARNQNYVDVRVRLGSDRDDVSLTYEIFRGWQTTTPIHTVTRESVSWRNESFTFRDTGVTRGQSVYYRVRVTDPAGQSTMSVRTPNITVGG